MIGLTGRKPFRYEEENDITHSRSPGELRASSRGNPEGASVIQHDWASRTRRLLFKTKCKVWGYCLVCFFFIKLECFTQVYRISLVKIKFLNLRKTAKSEGNKPAKYWRWGVKAWGSNGIRYPSSPRCQ